MYKKRQINLLNKQSIRSFDCSPCGRYIVCAVDKIIETSDLIKRKLIVKTAQCHTDLIVSVKYSPNGQLIASGSDDKIIIIWNSWNLQQIGKVLRGHESYIRCFTFSADNLYLISGGWDTTIRIWNCQNQEQVGENIKVDYWIYCLEYSSKREQILSAGTSNKIEIWDARSRQRIIQISAHPTFRLIATYSLDQRYILSSGWEGTIKVWDAETGEQRGKDLVGYSNERSFVSFSPDSSFIDLEVIIKQFTYGILKQESKNLLYKHIRIMLLDYDTQTMEDISYQVQVILFLQQESKLIDIIKHY